MKKLNLIELNEINFAIVKKYITEHPGRFQGFEKLLDLTNFETSSEDAYEHIEPWIQWTSVHTCQTYNQHQIFRLGDIVNYENDQIFEMIEKAGYLVGCMSPMNTENRLLKPAYFIPDPWTNTISDSSIMSKVIHMAIKQAVNDNSKGKISLSTYISLIWILITKTQRKNWLTYLKLFKLRKKSWNKALFLDLLLSDAFIYLKKKNKENFSCLFLNGFAHIQHHYLLNSKMYDGDLSNTPDYIDKYDDPIHDAIKIYDKIIFDLLNQFNERFLFATGLRQVPVYKKVIYYRLKNHVKFLTALGVRNFEVEPRMTRDFLVKFKNSVDLENAARLFSTIEYKGKPLFDEVEQRVKSLFVTLTYSDLVQFNDVIKLQGRTLNLFEEFVFVAIKNGHHDSLGYVFTNFKPEVFKSNDHVSVLGKEILQYFEL
tara:strand:+ start:2862 stop:4145 length:1284 start_codon:yes stop_codon:yes gene_type:complete